MLSLTKKTEYALAALIYLQDNRQRVCSAREIAELCKIPLPLLMNILKSLNQSQIVDSARGARGGYQLSCNPAEVSLNQIILALEGPVKLVQCVHDNHRGFNSTDTHCERVEYCTVRPSLLKIHAHIEKLLKEVSLADISARGESLNSEVSLTPLPKIGA